MERFRASLGILPLKSSFTFFAVFAILSFVTLARASTKIVWKPAAGSVYHFHWSAQSDDYPGPTGGATIKQEEDDTDTIQPLKPDGSIDIQVQITGVKASMNGSAVPSKASSTLTQNVEYSPYGVVLSRKSDDPNDNDNPRLDNVERLIYPDHPVNIGQSWKYHEDANKVIGTEESESTYTFAGRARLHDMPVLEIKFEYTELGTLLSIRAHGTFWISAEDGELVKKDIQAEGLTIGTGARPFGLHIVKERI